MGKLCDYEESEEKGLLVFVKSPCGIGGNIKLIDADKLKQYVLEQWDKTRCKIKGYVTYGAMRNLTEKFLMDIDKQPTAYDVDKVVGEISKLSVSESCGDCKYRDRCDYEQKQDDNKLIDLCTLTIRALAIDIVKRGGIEDVKTKG